MRRNKKIKLIQKISWLLTALTACVFLFSSPASKVVNNMDYLYMHVSLPMDYALPEEFTKEKLRFSGNYAKYVQIKYDSKKNKIRLTPKRTGSGIMIIKNQKNEVLKQLSIDIQRDNLHKIASELRDLLISVDGIEVKIHNKKVIIDGQIMLPREMDRINAVIQRGNYQQHVVSLVTYSPEAQKKLAEIVEKEIEYPEVTVRYAYNRFLLEGCVSSDEDRRRAVSIANLYIQFDASPLLNKTAERNTSLRPIQDNLTVPCESERKAEEENQKKTEINKLIQVVVHFVEMRKNFNKGFMFNWAPAIGDNGGTNVTGSLGNAPGAARGVTAVLTATVSNFFPKLNWAKSFGFARVLHNSSLLVENNVEGTINTETSTSQPTETGLVTQTSAQVSVVVKPTIIGEGENFIRMEIRVRVSSTPDQVGTTTRTINTTVHVRDGASTAIGGLITSILARNYNPENNNSGNQPLIKLHSQKGYKTTKSQFVVFLTPLIKSHSHIGVERIKEKFKLDE